MLKKITSTSIVFVITLLIFSSCGSKGIDPTGIYRRISKTDMSDDETYVYPKDSPHYQVGYEIYKEGDKVMVKYNDFTEEGKHLSLINNKEPFELSQTDDDIYQQRIESKYGEVTVYTFIFSENDLKVEEYQKDLDKGGFNHESSVNYTK